MIATDPRFVTNDILRKGRIKLVGDICSGDVVHYDRQKWVLDSVFDDCVSMFCPDTGEWTSLGFDDVLNLPIALPERDVKNHLLRSIYRMRSRICDAISECDSRYGSTECFYRLYYQSFKAFRVQYYTSLMYSIIQEIAVDSECEVHPMYVDVVMGGTGLHFSDDYNSAWSETVRPMFEAFAHSRMHMSNLLWCVKNIDSIIGKNVIPYEYASVLCLFGLR